MKIYLYEYSYDGKNWGLEITAHSKEDADDIVKRLPLARYDGVLEFQVKAPHGLAWFLNLLIKWKIYWKKNHIYKD